MFKSLNAGMLNIQADLAGTITLAKAHGFSGVDMDVRAVRQQLPEQPWQSLRERMLLAGVRPGVVGGLLPVRLGVPDQEWAAALAELPELAALARDLGYTRSTIVMLPFHDTLPYADCFRMSVARLRQVAPLLAGYGLSLGVEYVSQYTRRAASPNPFIYTLAGTLELLAAVQAPNVGLLLDSFHWYCAGESAADLAGLGAAQIVAVHVADAPNRPLLEQVAIERELPGQGVADLHAFCTAVRDTGYPGPAACEPFRKEFVGMAPAAVAARVSAALDSVMAWNG